MNIFSNTPRNFEYAFEKDHNPPLDLNSDAHKIYSQARDFENSKPALTPIERENLTAMYQEAAAMGHWKAKAEMLYRYANGIGVEKSSLDAADLARELVKIGVPIGYFNLGLLTLQGKGRVRDEKKGMELIHKAAELGSPDAQYMLGEHYIYSEHNDVLGLKYHVCAMRQGYGKSANAISVYMEIEKNYPMAVEYLLRAGGMGYEPAFTSLKVVFNSPDKPNTNLGFAQSAYMMEYADRHYKIIRSDPRHRFPSIGKECQVPTHPTLGNGRQLPSKLQEACGGMWPDEAYPELKDW